VQKITAVVKNTGQRTLRLRGILAFQKEKDRWKRGEEEKFSKQLNRRGGKGKRRAERRLYIFATRKLTGAATSTQGISEGEKPGRKGRGNRGGKTKSRKKRAFGGCNLPASKRQQEKAKGRE